MVERQIDKVRGNIRRKTVPLQRLSPGLFHSETGPASQPTSCFPKFGISLTERKPELDEEALAEEELCGVSQHRVNDRRHTARPLREFDSLLAPLERSR